MQLKTDIVFLKTSNVKIFSLNESESACETNYMSF